MGPIVPLFLLAITLLLAATAAHAATYGHITVVERPTLQGPAYNAYYEYRFDVANSGTKPSTVTLTAQTIQPYTSNAWRVSRSFVLAPGTAGVITIPQLVQSSSSAQTVAVVIDGIEQREVISLNSLSVSDASVHAVLVGDGVALGGIEADLQKASIANIVYNKSGIGYVDWSSSWMQYNRFGGILLTPRDWERMPPPVRDAIRRWSFAGGSLAFMGAPPADVPAAPVLWEHGPLRMVPHGLGRIVMLPESDAAFTAADYVTLRGYWRRPVLTTLETHQASSTLPLLPNKPLPTGSMFSVMFVFAIVAGPVNVIFLARRNKRLWLFWSVPAMAILAAIGIVASLLINEGWVRVQRSRTLTLLDENRGEAATFGWTGVYSTAAPDLVRFATSTALQVTHDTKAQDTVWADGQGLLSWVPSRVPTYFMVRKSEPRRERLTIRREGNQVVAVNGLGAPLTKLVVAMEDGSIYSAGAVGAGARIVLTRNATKLKEIAGSADELVRQPEVWMGAIQGVDGDPMSILQPGMYVAALKGTPFLETVVEEPTEVVHDAIVVGYMRRSSDAS
ncbi:MAG TPA: hypothetical protein VF618_20880 [Thermoanaerobaculia bacterium]